MTIPHENPCSMDARSPGYKAVSSAEADLAIRHADRLGLGHQPALVLATPATPPTNAQLDAARAATSSLTADPASNSFTLENGPVSQTALIVWILLAINAIIVIGASAVAIGLARVVRRPASA